MDDGGGGGSGSGAPRLGAGYHLYSTRGAVGCKQADMEVVVEALLEGTKLASQPSGPHSGYALGLSSGTAMLATMMMAVMILPLHVRPVRGECRGKVGQVVRV